MQLKVQEALARASCVYIMHVLRQHSRPQHERTERTDMFWEIKVQLSHQAPHFSTQKDAPLGVICPI